MSTLTHEYWTSDRLPSEWKLVHLGDVCEHNLGKMLDREKNQGELRPYLRNPNVQWFQFDLSDVQQMPIKDTERSKFALAPGDVVICEGGEAGRAAIWTDPDREVYIQKALHRVRVKPCLYNRFLVHVLMADAKSGRLNSYFTGTTIPHFTGQDLHRYVIPLPPLPEQKRIADILDKADAIRRKRQEALDALLSIPGSTFHEMFGTPLHNTKGWKIGTIRDLVCEVKYGSSSKASSEGQYPMLRMNNITYAGTWDLTDLKYIDIPLGDRAKYLVQKGDILFNRTNSKELVGKTAVFQEEAPMAFAGYLVRARTNELAHPDYIAGYLNSPHGKATLRHMCKSIVGMANINAQEFQDILIPHPPIEAQLEFVRVLEAIRRSEKPLLQAVKESESLFHSLVQRAFRGEL
jgi:type I restriction enzyme S subunit